MGNQNRPDRTSRALGGWSVLWKHLAMMLTILLVAVGALVITNVYSQEKLTEENLARFQAALDRDCEMLGNDMYSSIAIPMAIADSRHYEHIENLNQGVLDEKYHSLLQYIKRALLNQVYLEAKNDYSLLYLSGCNSIVTHGRLYPDAAVCFERDMHFSLTDEETVMAHLRTPNSITLLPVQEIEIPDKANDSYLPLIIRPFASKISIMTLYTDEAVLEALGVASLPEDTCLQLSLNSGEILWQYPHAVTEKMADRYYRLTGVIPNLNATVDVWIPAQYLTDIIQPAQIIGILVVAVVIIVGTSLSYVFSKMSVEPMRRIIGNYAEAQPFQGKNELLHLNHLLTSSRKRSQELTNRLTQAVLSRAISGSVLSQKDEQFLTEMLGALCDSYRIAIIQSPPEICASLCDRLNSVRSCVCTLLSQSEIGIIFDSSDESVSNLNDYIAKANEGEVAGDICCGISAPAKGLGNLHVAMRQARVSLPRKAATLTFPAENAAESSTSWLQQERFYQSICEKDEQSTLDLLEKIAREAHSDNAKYIFYNILFAICSAAGEMNVDLPLGRHAVEFRGDLEPAENITRLSGMLRDLFSQIREKVNDTVAGEDRKLLDFIRDNFADDYMSAPYAAERLKMSEKRVYETVRNLTGLSFSEYLLSLRMNHAAMLLRTTDDSIGEVAAQCGYQVESTFYRLFKKYYTVSPGQFRRNGGV